MNFRCSWSNDAKDFEQSVEWSNAGVLRHVKHTLHRSHVEPKAMARDDMRILLRHPKIKTKINRNHFFPITRHILLSHSSIFYTEEAGAVRKVEARDD